MAKPKNGWYEYDIFRTAIFRRLHTRSGRSSSTNTGCRRRSSSALGGRYRCRRRRLPASVRRQRCRRVGNVDRRRRRRQSTVGGRVEQIGEVPFAAAVVVVVFFVAEQQIRGTGRAAAVLLRALPSEVLASRRVWFAAPRRRLVRRRRFRRAAVATAVRPVQAQPIVGRRGFPCSGRGGRSPRLGHPPVVPSPGQTPCVKRRVLASRVKPRPD